MPLHGVGIIVGGTIAVVGSGYAFKKFVYDPHLAPYIEAFIAQHPILHSLSPSTPTSPTPVETRRAVPVAVSGTSSARQSHLTHARQRRSVHRAQDAEGMDLELEMRQPLLRAGEREEYLLDPEGLDDWGRSRRATMRVPKEDKGILRSSRKEKATYEEASTSHSLVDLAQVPIDRATPEDLLYKDCEIRSIVFDRDEISSPTHPSPLHPSQTLPILDDLVTQTTPPSEDQTVEAEKDIEPVTTLSSPPQSFLLDSWSVDIPIVRPIHPPAGEDVPPELIHNPFIELGIPHSHSESADVDNESDDEMAMISRPRTAHSDYIDAESYTPLNDLGTTPTFSAFPSLTSSPQRRHRSPPPLAETMEEGGQTGGVVADMGLSYIKLQSPTIQEGNGETSRGLNVRRSTSVISLSESEGGASDGWEAL